jgi:uncharacterized pyridoxal phosphate-dependent enzyme
MSNDYFAEYGLRRVVNGAGPLTILGAAPVEPEIVAAAGEILANSVIMEELQRAASKAIAEAFGAEAGCVTGCAAAGIAVSVAACIAGEDLAKIERLPDSQGMKNEVILQKGHECSFGASVSQMIRLGGGKPVEVGTATYCARYQVAAAIGPQTAAAVYVISHHTVPFGMLDLETFAKICHERGVPVIVDGAAQPDQAAFIRSGADLAVASAQKFPGGLTAGLIAGREALVRACELQRRGIGRPMKAGKEGIAGAIAALGHWMRRDKPAQAAELKRRSEALAQGLGNLSGVAANSLEDTLERGLWRTRVTLDPATAGLDARRLAGELAQGNPAIYVRNFNVDEGYVDVDVLYLRDPDIAMVSERVRDVWSRAQSRKLPPGLWVLNPDGSVGSFVPTGQ